MRRKKEGGYYNSARQKKESDDVTSAGCGSLKKIVSPLRQKCWLKRSNFAVGANTVLASPNISALVMPLCTSTPRRALADYTRPISLSFFPSAPPPAPAPPKIKVTTGVALKAAAASGEREAPFVLQLCGTQSREKRKK